MMSLEFVQKMLLGAFSSSVLPPLLLRRGLTLCSCNAPSSRWSKWETHSSQNPPLCPTWLHVGRGLFPLEPRQPVCLPHTNICASECVSARCESDGTSGMGSGNRGTYFFWLVPRLLKLETALSVLLFHRGMYVTRIQQLMTVAAVGESLLWSHLLHT